MKKILWLIVCLMTMCVTANAQKHTRQEIKDINFRISIAEGNHEPLTKIDSMKLKRDEMVSTFSVEEKTIKFGMTLEQAKQVVDICGWWSKHSSSFTEEGEIELIHFDVFNTFYLNNKKLTNDNNYMLTFINGELKKIEVAENTAQKRMTEIEHIKSRIEDMKSRFSAINRKLHGMR